MINLNNLTPITLAKLANSLEDLYKDSEGTDRRELFIYYQKVVDAGESNCGAFEFNKYMVEFSTKVI